MRRILVSACFLLAASSAVLAQTPSPAPAGAPAPRPPPLIISSSAITDGGVIPDKYTVVSQTPVSPPLSWINVPATAQSLVLIVHDVDVVMQKGMGDNPHWIVFNIPANVMSLAENQPATPTLSNGGVQMTRKTAQGAVANVGFAPPGPPPGFFHHYDFDLYALDTKLALDTNASRADIEAAMVGHIVAKGVMQTRFKR